MVSVILKVVLGDKIVLGKKKKFVLNTPIFPQYCGITQLCRQNNNVELAIYQIIHVA